jgi:hypothetical protein
VRIATDLFQGLNCCQTLTAFPLPELPRIIFGFKILSRWKIAKLFPGRGSVIRQKGTPTEADALIQQQVVNLIPSLCQGLVP